MYMCTVFLDLSKALDKVLHSMLLQKLAGLGIDPHLLASLRDYLCNRSQHVAVNGESSSPAQLFLVFHRALFWALSFFLSTSMRWLR